MSSMSSRRHTLNSLATFSVPGFSDQPPLSGSFSRSAVDSGTPHHLRPLRVTGFCFRDFARPAVAVSRAREPSEKAARHGGERRAARVGSNEPETAPDRSIPMSTKKMMQLVAVVERGEGEDKKGYWTRIGAAFENRDGSWNLRFDYLPARMAETTIQMRPANEREER